MPDAFAIMTVPTGHITEIATATCLSHASGVALCRHSDIKLVQQTLAIDCGRHGRLGSSLRHDRLATPTGCQQQDDHTEKATFRIHP